MNNLALAHRSFIYFLLAARSRSTASSLCVLTMLNAHGIYFAMKSKQLIAVFSGIPIGATLTTLNAALRNIQQK